MTAMKPPVLTNAQKTEKQIDGTKLDPCTNAVLDKLKNLKQADIAGILAKFGGNSETYFNLRNWRSRWKSPCWDIPNFL